MNSLLALGQSIVPSLKRVLGRLFALAPPREEMKEIQERLGRVEREVRRMLHLLTSEQEGKKENQAEAVVARSLTLDSTLDYFGFENRFRGSQEEIKQRQKRYVEYFAGREPILDMGCGRGEFLELLRAAGVHATGLDVNPDMFLHCREKGLNVVQSDVFTYLGSLPGESLGGIFSAQMIEHFPPEEIIRLVRLCQSKLKPNGVIILETVNPQCLTTLARAFYLDFSHRWPCHPEAMRFLLESIGFSDIRLEFSAPVDPGIKIPILQKTDLFGKDTERFNRAAALLNELIFGYQDYAIIARRI